MNNYHLVEELGRGKQSVVHKGRKKKSIHYVAIKSYEKSKRKKFLNEVKIFSTLNHPMVVQFYHWYETRNHLWIIQEYCPGGDLQSLLKIDQTLPEEMVKLFARNICEALLYLHSTGVIFADLKFFAFYSRPSNILLNEYNELKFGDFGLARKIVDLIKADSSSESINKRGTPHYMAPELFHDSGVYSFQSDFWALGITLYEFACGHPPFDSKNFEELVEMIYTVE